MMEVWPLVPLSKRWREISRLYSIGLKLPQIAQKVGCAEVTVQRCVYSRESREYIKGLRAEADREVIRILARRELRRIMRCLPK